MIKYTFLKILNSSYPKLVKLVLNSTQSDHQYSTLFTLVFLLNNKIKKKTSEI